MKIVLIASGTEILWRDIWNPNVFGRRRVCNVIGLTFLFLFHPTVTNQRENTMLDYCMCDCCVLSVRSQTLLLYALLDGYYYNIVISVTKLSAISLLLKAAGVVWEPIFQKKEVDHMSQMPVYLYIVNYSWVSTRYTFWWYVKEFEVFCFLRRNRWSQPVTCLNFTAQSPNDVYCCTSE